MEFTQVSLSLSTLSTFSLLPLISVFRACTQQRFHLTRTHNMVGAIERCRFVRCRFSFDKSHFRKEVFCFVQWHFFY